MKPREHDGVVDPRLNVRGVQALKVSDLSTPLSNVAANMYSTVLRNSESQDNAAPSVYASRRQMNGFLDDKRGSMEAQGAWPFLVIVLAD